MPMTPEEYAAKELNVPGYTDEAPTYAPGEQGIDPNIQRVLNGGTPTPEQVIDANLLAMQHEYNFVLPIALRRAEVDTQVARANFWNSLAAFITSLVG